MGTCLFCTHPLHPFETRRELNYRHAEKRGFFAEADEDWTGSIEGGHWGSPDLPWTLVRRPVDPFSESYDAPLRHPPTLATRTPVATWHPRTTPYTTAVVGGDAVMFEIFFCLWLSSSRAIVSRKLTAFFKINLSSSVAGRHSSTVLVLYLLIHRRPWACISMTASQSISIMIQVMIVIERTGQRIDRCWAQTFPSHTTQKDREKKKCRNSALFAFEKPFRYFV